MIRDNGFSLLEVLTALAVSAAALIPIIAGFQNILGSSAATDRATVAALLAHGLVVQLESMPPTSRQTDGAFGEDFPDFTWEADFEPLPQLPGAIALEVRLRYLDAGIERSLGVRTLLLEALSHEARRPGSAGAGNTPIQ